MAKAEHTHQCKDQEAHIPGAVMVETEIERLANPSRLARSTGGTRKKTR
jgi:hypothetical protein